MFGADFHQVGGETYTSGANNDLFQVHEGVLVVRPFLISIPNYQALAMFAQIDTVVVDDKGFHMLSPSITVLLPESIINFL